MLALTVHEITVYFVGKNYHSVLHGYFRQLLKVLPFPNFANRIVRVAQNEESGLAIEFSLKIFKIHTVGTVLIYQRIFNYIATTIHYGVCERIIHGRLDDNLVSRSCECLDGHAYSGHNTG